jgi:lipopolysaccharide export LptBFGC system permease protein LptF
MSDKNTNKEKLNKPLSKREKQLAAEAMEYFIQYVSSPWRIVWVNFLAGVFRGLGALIGASIVLALIAWVLTQLVDVPLVGEYAKDIKSTMTSYVKDTNYNDDFDRIADTLERIEKELAEDNK